MRTKPPIGQGAGCVLRAGQMDHSVAHLDRVDRCRLERRQLEGFAGDQTELAAVLPALAQPLLDVDLPFGQRDVLVGAAVTDGVHVVPNPHDRDRQAFNVEAPRLASPRIAPGQVLEPTERDAGVLVTGQAFVINRAAGVAYPRWSPTT